MNKILGVNNGRIQTAQALSPSSAHHAARRYENMPTKLTANLGGGALGLGGGMNSVSATATFGSQYQYYMTGILPTEPSNADTSSLILFYRDAYLFDNVAGSCVDIQSSFPFSTWELRGLPDNELNFFNDCCTQLNMLEKMPEISNSFLVDGHFCASLIFDAQAKQFNNALVHDALQCLIQPSPFFNFEHEIQVRTSAQTLHMLNSVSKFTKDYMRSLPRDFLDMLRSGSFTLNPATTLFVGRKTLSDRAFVSYLHRILPMYLIEKTMFRGTLVEANRRQRAMTHLTAGDDLWTPTGEELAALVQQFQMAEYDPLGGWISTRSSVQANDLRPGGEFWKWTDMADILVPYKLRALGISESFLSQEGCLVGDTLVSLTNGYKKTIESLCPVLNVKPYELPIGQWYNLDINIPNKVSGSAQTKSWCYSGVKETFTVTTDEGHIVTASGNHPFWVQDANGNCSWKRLDELVEGDMIGVED